MPQIMVLGEALIDVFAEMGIPLREAHTLHPRPGGAPANVAYALAGLGADVGFVGKVGTDDYGYWLIDILRDKGVDTTYFEADPSAPTMLAIVAAPMWARVQAGLEIHWTWRGGPTTVSWATQLLSAPCRY